MQAADNIPPQRSSRSDLTRAFAGSGRFGRLDPDFVVHRNPELLLAAEIDQSFVSTHARGGTGSGPVRRRQDDTDARRCAGDHEVQACLGAFLFFRDFVIGDGLL